MVYQPAHGRFVVEDSAALLLALSSRVPATLITHGANGFRSTLLPMLFENGDGSRRLVGHVARGNPHWREVNEDTSALAVLTGPEAYISPSWYAEKAATGKVVPTWNYVTVHVEGKLRAIHDRDWLRSHVSQLVDRHERDRREPWSLYDAPPDYVDAQLRGIVGLELDIRRLEAKRKLGQNRSAADSLGAIAGLDAGTPGEQATADEMRKELHRLL